MMTTLPHEFDSSGTCNYCGIAVERVPNGTQGAGDSCPRRCATIVPKSKTREEGYIEAWKQVCKVLVESGDYMEVALKVEEC